MFMVMKKAISTHCRLIQRHRPIGIRFVYRPKIFLLQLHQHLGLINWARQYQQHRGIHLWVINHGGLVRMSV